MHFSKTNIKKIISWTLAIPSFVLAVSEYEDLNLWWIQFLAMGVLIVILGWNGAFKKGD